MVDVAHPYFPSAPSLHFEYSVRKSVYFLLGKTVSHYVKAALMKDCTLPNLSPLELEYQVEYETWAGIPIQVEYGFKLEFQVELLIRWESVG